MKVSIIGAGIVGLMSALRFVKEGFDVTVFETNKCGNGASTKNQGMIHSGAMYAKLHPEIVSSCIEAQDLFSYHFPEARILTNRSIYYGSHASMSEYRKCWNAAGISYRMMSSDNTCRYFIREKELEFAKISQEGLYSARHIINILVQECVAAGVEILINTSVKDVVHKAGRVVGVIDSFGSIYQSDIVINSSGISIKTFLEDIESKYADGIVSRLGTAVVIKNTGLNHIIVSTEFKGCNIVPTDDGHLIVIVYGARQPSVEATQNLCVASNECNKIIEVLKNTFSHDLYDTTDAKIYSSAKTEFIGRCGTDQWNVNPGHYVIDHSDDGINGLYTCLPGKFTLAFHATRDLLSKAMKLPVCRTDLQLPEFIVSDYGNSPCVSMEPWKIMNNP